MKFITVDIDDTLIRADKVECEECERITYKNHRPIISEIEQLKYLSGLGYIIILNTGRGWDQYKLTKQMLIDFEIPHNELIMGKPPGPYIDTTMNIKSLNEVKHD